MWEYEIMKNNVEWGENVMVAHPVWWKMGRVGNSTEPQSQTGLAQRYIFFSHFIS